ncbi:class I SAM-dependent DNA methyltransferase [uncultured Methylobacterium sp.]|uniref:class I SAM-dependent DNA methyltransferase n=1 Tax=uncultured Methylobacterium sp. TaxID=157278 RepID=UPI0035CC8D1C
MTPAAFIEKWSRSELRERQGAQSHFNDLCALIGEPNPTDADPLGASYCFERGATKVGGGDGWADVWRRGCFGWEYKGKHKDLSAALRQLQIYAPDLENPPYLVVCDMERIVVHTNWTNTVRRTLTYGFDDLREPARLDELRQVFSGSEALKPGLSPQELTAKAAARFGDLGRRLQERGHEPQAVAHFLNRLIFCLFAEDAEILPKGLFTRLMLALSRVAYFKPAQAKAQFDGLFSTMRTGGFFGADVVRWFNGGLFDDAQALPLERADLDLLAGTAREHDWSNIDPAVFGTMFEEALKTTGRRAALGAHYTDREKILKIVEPVVIRPLAAEWAAALPAIRGEADAMDAADAERKAVHEAAALAMEAGAAAYRAGEAGRRRALADIAKRRDAALARATALRDAFLARLAAFRVLDPACGSGNFLYVALHALRDIELRALLDADRLGVPQVPPRVGLDAVRGLEIEAYAAELARVTLWIGNLQWERRNGYTAYVEPVLHALDTIEHRDALLNPDGTEAAWPPADVIVGNPPFLGGKRLRDGLGDATVERLFSAYRGRVPAEADLVCYWVEKAWRAVGGPTGTDGVGVRRAGLVTTNSIRGGANRRVLEPIAAAGAIREAWSDEPWVLKGAAVRVSMIGFGVGFDGLRLNGMAVTRLNADLTGSRINLAMARRLNENRELGFQGPVLIGSFQVPGDIARGWLKLPLNPNGYGNREVLYPILNASDIARRCSDRWVVDFFKRDQASASLFEAPFQYVLNEVRPERIKNRRQWRAEQWWRHGESGDGWRSASAKLNRYLITPRVAKYRLFIWADKTVFPDSATVSIARDDDVSFGFLQSNIHEIWSIRLGTSLGVGNDPRYTPSTTFETFPFPENLTPDIPAADYADDPRAKAIAEAAAELNRLRENWLNPADLVRIEPEVVPGYPDRVLPKDAAAAAVLKTRTLTALYNARPAWLDNAHRRLDAAVAAAYGWPADLTDDAILERLFALNQARAAAGR